MRSRRTAPSHKPLQGAGCIFLSAPQIILSFCGALFLLIISTIWNLQTVSRLMVCWLTAAEKIPPFYRSVCHHLCSKVVFNYASYICTVQSWLSFYLFFFLIKVNIDHREEASGWWVEFEFAYCSESHETVSTSTDPLLHANIICAILSKTKQLCDIGNIGFSSLWQLPWHRPECN